MTRIIASDTTLARGSGVLVIGGTTVRSAPYNATGDGTTDDYDAFSAALAAMDDVIVPEGTYLIDSNLTIPAANRLIMQAGAVLRIPAGKRLTVLGEVDAGARQCFECQEVRGTITSISNATPVVVTTSSAHGLETGDWVTNEGIGRVAITAVTNPDFDPENEDTHKDTVTNDFRFRVTTSGAHGISASSMVRIEECDLAAANGEWLLVADDSTHFKLFGSKGNGGSAGTTGYVWVVPAAGAGNRANGEYQITKLTDTTFSLDLSNADGAESGGRFIAQGHVKFSTLTASAVLPSPWSGELSIENPAKQTVVRPEWFGAVMNDSTAAEDNSTALELAMRSLPDTGGEVVWGGYLFLDRTIYPARAFIRNHDGVEEWRNKGVVLRGVSGGAGIVKVEASGDTDDQPAYRLHVLTQRHQPAHTSPIGIMDMQIFSAHNGVETYSGGKQLVLKNLLISQCHGLFALYMFDTSGFLIDDVYLFRNRHSGGWFEQCYAIQCIMLRSRENGFVGSSSTFTQPGRGLFLINSEVWTGQIYPEANGSYGVDARHFSNFDLFIWQESNREYDCRSAVSGTNPGGLSQFQSRLQLCNGIFRGKHGGYFGSHFEMDEWSAGGVRYVGDAANSKGEMFHPHISSCYAGMVTHTVTQLMPPLQKDTAFAHVNLNESAWSGGLAPYVPVLSIVESESYSGYGAIKLELVADAFANKPGDETTGWLNPSFMGLSGASSAMGTVSYQAGDMFLARWVVRLDAAAATYYAAQSALGTGAVPIKAQLDGDGLATGDRNCYMDHAGPCTFELTSYATSADTGVRLLFYTGLGSESGPDETIGITIESVEVYHYSGTMGARQSLAIPRLPALADAGFPSSLTGVEFDPGFYITAPRIGIRGNQIYPQELNNRKFYSGSAPPNELCEEGSFWFNDSPSDGTLGWSCISRVDTTKITSSEDGGKTVMAVASTSGMTVADKIALVIAGQDAGGDYYGHQTLHWTTIASIGGATSLTLTNAIPANHYIEVGWPIYTMDWAAVST